MIVGTGVDIEKIARFEGNDKRKAFMRMMFTAQEQEYLKTGGIKSMAGLYAAKEAVVKALGTGFKGFRPYDIEINHDALGKPYVILHRNAEILGKEKATLNRIKKRQSRFISDSREAPLRSSGQDNCGAVSWRRTKRRRKGCSYSSNISIHVSISHNETDAIAFAVIEV